MRLKLRAPSHTTVVAYVALFVAMSGSAYAATGGTFVLGKSNYASGTTALRSGSGSPLSLVAPAGRPPLAVNRPVRVPRLNADQLDGVDSTALQRVIPNGCDAGEAIKRVTRAGGIACTDLLQVTEYISDASFIGAWVNCPAGYKVTGGGYSLGLDAPATTTVDVSRPWPANNVSGEGWFIHADGAVGSAAAVFAICQR